MRGFSPVRTAAFFVRSVYVFNELTLVSGAATLCSKLVLELSI